MERQCTKTSPFNFFSCSFYQKVAEYQRIQVGVKNVKQDMEEGVTWEGKRSGEREKEKEEEKLPIYLDGM